MNVGPQKREKTNLLSIIMIIIIKVLSRIEVECCTKQIIHGVLMFQIL